MISLTDLSYGKPGELGRKDLLRTLAVAAMLIAILALQFGLVLWVYLQEPIH